MTGPTLRPADAPSQDDWPTNEMTTKHSTTNNSDDDYSGHAASRETGQNHPSPVRDAAGEPVARSGLTGDLVAGAGDAGVTDAAVHGACAAGDCVTGPAFTGPAFTGVSPTGVTIAGLGVALTGRALLDGRVLWGPLDLRLEAGRWTCLLGPSGAGKTTLLRLVAGLPTGAAFEGTVTAADGAPLSARVTVMGQSPALPPWLGVLGAVTLGARLRGRAPDRDRAMAMIARVGLQGMEHRRPGQLSGGQAQRAALARALVEDRPVVVLDEPFAALDARTRAEMQDLAFETLAGRTVLLATHDPLEAARLGHAAWLLQDGGLTPLPLPAAPPPRSLDDPATLAAQAAIFARLRGTTA